MNDLPKRKLIRLPDYDYSQNGAYFVTICTHGKKCVLSKITTAPVGAGLRARPIINLTETGLKVKSAIEFINTRYLYTRVDKYVIMPNHVHLIISIDNNTGGPGDPPLQDIIGRMKSYSSNRYGQILWQRSYHEHVIRSDNEYLSIWNYIDTNPIKWTDDEYYLPSSTL